MENLPQVASTNRRAWNRRTVNPGDKFGWLEVIEELDPYISKSGNKFRQLRLRCKCGKETIQKLGALLEARVVSCGCYGKIKRIKHGFSSTKIYKIRTGMCQRCHNPNDPSYYKYGAKGIKVCAEWRADPEAFVTWALENGYKEGLTIDRKDSSGNYEPDNCRFVGYKVQNNNTSRNRWLEAFGERKTVAQWLDDDRCVPDEEILRSRIKRGWDAERAMTTPVIHRKPRQ